MTDGSRSTDSQIGLLAWAKGLATSVRGKLGPHRYLFAIAGVIGLLDGVAAVALKSSVHGAEDLARHLAGATGCAALLAAFPVIGIALSYLWVRFFVKDDIGHGICRVLEVISTPCARMKPHNMFSSLVGCTLTAGFGGSVGMEGPIVATGAAIGDNVAALTDGDYKRRMILIGCGAAGAIAAIFKAPFAGLVFCVEVFALDVASSSVIALLISTAVATLFSMVVSGYQIEFHFSVHERFSPRNVPFYIALGIISAFVSVYFMRVSRAVEGAGKRVRSPWLKIALGGAAVGLSIFAFPALYGEGYLAMHSMLTDSMPALFTHSPFEGLLGHAWAVPLLLVAVALVKPIATAATTSSGGVGGTFAPALFVGCAIGYSFAVLCDSLGIARLPPMNFALAGMAGALSGIMAAPLTGIFLIAELTGGYELFIPLIIVSSVSTVIARHFEPFSIYARRLGKAGRLITHHRDKAALTLLQVKDLIERGRPSVPYDMDVSRFTELVAANPAPFYPVVDRAGGFVGLVDAQDILPILANAELRERLVLSDLLHEPRVRLNASLGASAFFSAFANCREEELPAFEGERLLGFITRAALFEAYKAKMAELSEGNEA
ncbi:MAG TPA: chloride channel protein [Treponemataceae bacterium]|nr:chloride channel protein [Treponemataceae bacterium]HPS43018.1 chloride channel protein [Treponemataceae bacterium]